MTQVFDPPAIEVFDFKFVQLRRLKLNQEDEGVPTDAINLIATSSRYGLVFVGFSGGFKVLKLENILDQDEDKKKFRQAAENYPCQTVSCATPVLLSLSSDDMTLAVCVVIDTRVVADMYDIRAFADPGIIPTPFLNVQLSSHGSELQDFMWNPVSVEMYSFCLRDGSLHVHEVADVNLKIVASLPAETGATSVCWSPKGKQVVVGKKNGYFSQYKPTLQEAKTVAPPNIDGLVVEVLNIYWLTTTSFAVAYLTQDKLPTLMLVSTPKGASVVYTIFGDVCLGTDTQRNPRYLMHHQAEWRVLMCSSAGAIETAILGCTDVEKNTWLQWALEDGGRAEVPLEKYAETYPLGMNVIFCAQRRVVISDQEVYQPMPILFLLSTNGMLCPFHMLNLRPGVTSCVFPSEPICCDGERKNIGAMTTMKQPIAQSTPQKPAIPTATIQQTTQPLSVPIASNVPITIPVPFGMGEVKPSLSFGKIEPTPPSLFAPRTQTQASFMPVQSSRVAPAALLPAAVRVPSVAPASQHSQSIGVAPQSVAAHEIITTVKHPAPNDNIQVPSAQPLPKPDVNQQTEPATPSQDIYIAAMIDEIKTFEAELRGLKSLSFSREILTQEEIAEIRKNSLLLTDFHKDVKDTMQTLNLDIHNLKTASLESFALIGEANSRNIRRNDTKYISMLRDRALDPLTAKRNQKIHQLHQYLNTQLQEVHNKLDRDLMERTEKHENRKRNRLRLSSSQAIYQTIVSNQNISYNLKNQVERLSDGFNKLKTNNALRAHHLANISAMSSDGDLEKLADSLLENKEQIEPIKKKLYGRKKFSPEVHSALRNLLANRPVVCERPKLITSPSQSQLLAASVLQANVKTRSKAISCDVRPEDNVPLAGRTHHQLPSADMHNNEVSSAQEDIRKTLNVLKSPLELKPLSAFTLKSGQPQSFGCITEGTPVAKLFTDNSSKIINVDESPNVNTAVSAKHLAFTDMSASSTEAKAEPNANNKSSFFNLKFPVTTFALNKPDQPVSSTPGFSSFSFDASNPDGAKRPPVSLFESHDSVLPSNEEFKLYEDITPPLSLSDVAEHNSLLGEAYVTVAKSGEQTVFEIRSPTTVQAPSFSIANVFSLTSPSAFPVLQSQAEPSGEVFVISTSTDDAAEGKENEFVSGPTITPINLPSTLAVAKSPSNPSVSILNTSNPVVEKLMGGGFSSIQPGNGTPSQNQLFTLGENALTSMSVIQRQQPETVTTSKEASVDVISSSSDQLVSSIRSLAQSDTGTVTEFSKNNLLQDNVIIVQPPPQTKNDDSVTVTDATALKLEFKLPESTTLTPIAEELKTEEVTTTTEQQQQQSVITDTSTATTATMSSFFGQNTSTTTTSSFFGAIPGFSTTPATTASSFFNQPASTQSSFFSKPAFGQSAAATTSASASVFGQAASTTTIFGQPTTTAAATGPFGQAATVTPATNPFGQPAVTIAASSPFGQPAASTATSPFGQAAVATNPFGQANTVGNVFGQTPASSSFFNSPAEQTSIFGQKEQQTGSSIFGGGQSSGFFGKPAFGQTPPSSFGLAKAVFGQPAGQASGGFGQTADQGSMFGQSSFFGGLGNKPSEQNAAKNVFGSTGATSPSNTPNLFGNQGASTFGSKTGSLTGGSFSMGGGSVSQSGFAAFQQTPQKTVSFGSPPAFGSSTFGGSASFGGSPGALGGSPLFGNAQSSFSNFASTDAPTFGTLATQGSGFGSVQQTGFGQAAQGGNSMFGGSPIASPPVFGGGASSPPSFGSQQSGFGSPSGGGSSAFSQWRS